jgi:hypothetical protein
MSKNPKISILISAIIFLAATSLPAQVTGKAIVTISAKKYGQPVPAIAGSEVIVEVGRNKAQVTGWSALKDSPVELLFAIDDSLQQQSALQNADIEKFIDVLPANILIGISYIDHGSIRMATKGFTKDHEAAKSVLRMTSGVAGISSSPYFAISDASRNWPGITPGARHEMLLMSNGIEQYGGRRFDPQDPYFEDAIRDAKRAHLIVDSIYIRDSRQIGGEFTGDNYLTMLASGTGGSFLNPGVGSPISIGSYLADLLRHIENQYELTFFDPKGKRNGPVNLRIRLENNKLEALAPDEVEVVKSVSATN